MVVVNNNGKGPGQAVVAMATTGYKQYNNYTGGYNQWLWVQFPTAACCIFFLFQQKPLILGCRWGDTICDAPAAIITEIRMKG